MSRVSSRVYYIVSGQVFVVFDFSGPCEPHVPCPCQTDFKHEPAEFHLFVDEITKEFLKDEIEIP